MKKVTLMSVAVLGFIGLQAGVAQAAEVQGQGKETPTTITIKDVDDKDGGVDPLNPTDKNQKHLTLEKVPGTFDFTSTLQNNVYQLDGAISKGNTIEVFNDRSARDWSVKATVKENEIKSDKHTFKVTSFKVDGEEIAATGSKGVVFKSATDKTNTTNTGLLTKAVNEVAINFTDTERVLKAGDQLNGTIEYQLFNTPTAE